LYRKAKLCLVGLLAVVFVAVSFLPPSPGIRFIWDPHTQPRFAIAAWGDGDGYGQGIDAFLIYENSTGSWDEIPGGPFGPGYTETYTFNWTAGIAIKVTCYTWFNSTLTGATTAAEGKKYQRHNVTVTNGFGDTVFSKQNFTYYSCDTGIAWPMWFYEYYVVLNFLPGFGEYYIVTVTYETYYAGAWTGSPAWLTGYGFRQSHVISPSSGAGTNYPVSLNVTRTAGTSSGAVCYVGTSGCQSDFDDVRFTDNDGTTLLDHWREGYSSTTAKFWIEVKDDLSTSPATIYVYYGYASASSASNGTNTFIFFDDFENNNWNRWTAHGSYWSIVDASEYVKMGAYAAYGDAGATEANRELNKTLSSINYPVMLHMWFRKAVTASAEAIGQFANNTSTTSYAAASNGALGAGTYYTPSWLYYGKAMVLSTWYRYEVGWDKTNSSFQPYIDRVAYSERSARLTTAVVLSQFSQLTVQVQAPTAGSDNWVDDVYLRKWLPSEPAHSTWGTVEDGRTWNQAGDAAVLYFFTPIDTFSLHSLLILIGLIMIPASTLYLVANGTDSIDSKKIFVFFILFLFGWALFLGVINP
jgi:hypothetical protein